MGLRIAVAALGVAVFGAGAWALQEATKDQIRTGLKDTELQGTWIYDDLPAGLAQAKASGKPLLVVFRCVPCVTFKQIDKQVASREDPGLAALMEKFVCVRIVQAWGMDLSQFQFDQDLNWAVFLMNADKTIYGRYGTKCAGKDPVRLSSIAGLKKALEGALECHAGYPANKKDFAGKTGGEAAWKVPEEIPEIQKRPNAKPADGTRQRCIHCHMIHEAEAWSLRASGKAVPDRLLWPYPLPDELGLLLDPAERATVVAVLPGSPAEKGGFQAGDKLERLEGQPLLSIADVQWVLHNAPEPSTLTAQVERGGRKQSASLEVAAGWRQKGDLAWRTLVWSMRHKLLGTEPLEALPAEERSKLGLAEGGMALRIKNMPPAFVKEKNPDAAGKLQKGDVIVEVDGRKDLSESGVLALLMNKKAGSTVDLTFLRAGQTQKVSLQIP